MSVPTTAPGAPATRAVPGAPGTPVPAPAPGARPSLRSRAMRVGFGLIGPRRDRHTLPAEALAELALPVGDDGVVIGEDAQGEPAVLGFNRPTPFHVVLIGGLWTAQVLALRMAGTGARVAVETGRGASWAALAQAAGGEQQCMTLHDVGRVPPQGGSAAGPVLVVRDCGMRPPRGRVVPSPWQSVLTLLPYLSPVAPRLMDQADVVGIQRVSPQEAVESGRIMEFGQDHVTALSTLGDGVTLWCTKRDRQFVMTSPTDVESGLLGTARRMD